MLLSIDLLGLHEPDLHWYQLLVRTFIVFIAAMAFIRLSGMRTFGTSSAFDVVVSISLGAIMGKCIMGHYPFFGGLLAGGTLVTLHRVVAWLSARNAFFCVLTEGKPVLLYHKEIKEVQEKKQYNITDQEIEAALHEQNIDSYENVKAVWLEPDGKLSIVKEIT